MLIKNETDIKEMRMAGEKGEAILWNFYEEGIIFRTAILKKGTVAPKKPHKHKDKQINYILSGEGEVTNGVEVRQVKTGDFLFFDSEEEHYFTAKTEIHTLELRF